MRILVPKPWILVPKLQRLEGPSRSREEDEHVAGQRLLYRVAPPWDTEDGRVVAVAAELGCALRVVLETSSLSSGRKRAMSVSEQPEEDAVCNVRSCASSRG